MTAEDRISLLPDDILRQILSKLSSIEEAVQTSVLSSRWRRVWSTQPDLDLTFSYSVRDTVAIIDSCLLQASSLPKLRSVRFRTWDDDPGASVAMKAWVRFAAERQVERLSICARRADRTRLTVEVPSTLFDCLLLSKLRIAGCYFIAGIVPAPGSTSCTSFAFLKALHLAEVKIDSDGLAALLLLCPGIEDLSLYHCWGPLEIVIDSSTLKRLSVNYCLHVELEIVRAPLLSYFTYTGDVSLVVGMERLKILEEALLAELYTRHPFENRRQWRQFIHAVADAKILSVNCWFFQFLLKEEHDSEAQPIFKNLTELHWWHAYMRYSDKHRSVRWDRADSLGALIFTLRDCPLLEQLCFHCARNYEDESDDDYESDDDDEGRPYDTCDAVVAYEGVRLSNLKTVSLVQFSGREEEFQLLKFLLGGATELELLIVNYALEVSEQVEDMSQEIESLPRASRCVKLFFCFLECCKFFGSWCDDW